MMSSSSYEVAFVRPPRVFWPLFGLGVVLSSVTATFLVTWLIPFSEVVFSDLVYVYSSLATLLTVIPLWWLLILRPARATPWRGCLVGILASILAYPLMGLIAVLWRMNPLFSMAGTIPPDSLVTLAILGPIFVGWITVPIGAVTGVLLIYLQLALTQRWWPSKMISEK